MKEDEEEEYMNNADKMFWMTYIYNIYIRRKKKTPKVDVIRAGTAENQANFGHLHVKVKVASWLVLYLFFSFIFSVLLLDFSAAAAAVNVSMLPNAFSI